MNEVADGDVSSQFYVLIKYRKVQKPQQFEYSQVLDTTASGVATATVTTPMVTEQSFDIPTNAGGGVPGTNGDPGGSGGGGGAGPTGGGSGGSGALRCPAWSRPAPS